MKYLSLIVILTLLLSSAFASQDTAFDVTRLSPKGRVAYQKLMSVEVFSVGGVGYSGVTSKGELALHDLLAETDAVAALKSLVRDAYFEGALYGLLGLSITNVEEFNRSVEVFKVRDTPSRRTLREPYSWIAVPQDGVVTQFGCSFSAEDRLKLVAQIQSGRFDKMHRLTRQ